MKTVIIVGAGQMGRTAAGIVNRNNYKIIGYADNDVKKQGTLTLDGFKIISVADAVEKNPDIMLIAIMGEVRSCEVSDQIRGDGYQGRIVLLEDETKLFDVRSFVLKRIADKINSSGIEGDAAELGVYKGDFAWQINEAFPDRKLYLFDTFAGFSKDDVEYENASGYSTVKHGEFGDTDIENGISRMPYKDKVIVKKGHFPETACGLEDRKFAFVSLDADLYVPTLSGITFFYPRLEKGGYILVHDYYNERFKGVKDAVKAYERNFGILNMVPIGDLHGSVVITK